MFEWQFNPWLQIPTFCSGALAVWAALVAWRRRSAPGALPAIMTMLAVALWSWGVNFEHASPTIPAKLWWIKVQYPGIAFVSVAWFALILGSLGYRAWLTRRALYILCAIPFIAVIGNWTNQYHHLFYTRTWLEYVQGMPFLAIDHGVIFWVFVAYVYLLIAMALMLAVHAVILSTRVYRFQALTLLGAAVAPLIANVLYLLRASPVPGLDFTPLVFALSGILLIWGYRRYHLWALSPVTYQSMMEHLPDGMLVLDTRHTILHANPAALRLLGSSVADPVGHSAGKIAPWMAPLMSMASGATSVHTVTISSTPLIVYELRITSLARDRIMPHGSLILIRDVTDRRRLEIQLEELAFYDPLTGLPNRRACEDLLAQEFARGLRRETRTAVLYIDLDQFKQINDLHGHHIGDIVLQQVANRLTNTVRAGDTVARFGGDEFVLVLPDVGSTSPESTAERILAAFQEPLQIANLSLVVTPSIGITVAPEHGDSVNALLRQGDQAMYAAKRAGGNTYQRAAVADLAQPGSGG